MSGYSGSSERQRGTVASSFVQEPIAIVGIGCRFSGDSDSPSALWTMLEGNQSGFGELPRDRYSIDSFYHPNRTRPGSLSVRGGYYLKEDIRNFDPGFFGIRAEQAKIMDPLQRKLLETAFEAIDSSGSSLDKISGSNCGVYVANFTSDWADVLGKDAEYPVEDHSLAYQPALLSNRLSHCFNMKGPSMTLNTACSGSLYALHGACNALQMGECDSALVGGANLTFSPDLTITLSHAGMLSPSSMCKSFDDSADGYGRGDGVAVFYLKRLSVALEENDPIRGVIRGTAVTANGRTSGVTHPSTDGQISAILAAYDRCQLDPRDTMYVECHGTGTAVGDPVEIAALAAVFKRDRSDSLLIGSVKTNLGHSEATSGIAGVLKAILALENGVIPATLGLHKLSTNINWNSGVKVVKDNTSINPSGVRRASINSFGFGGANAHWHSIGSDCVWCVCNAAERQNLQSTWLSTKPILSFSRRRINLRAQTHSIVEAVDSMIPGYKQSQRWITKRQNSSRLHETTTERKRYLIAVSGHDDVALEGNIALVRQASREYDLLDLSYTLGISRSQFVVRSFAIADNTCNEKSLHASSSFALKAKKLKAPQNVAFIFTGQGSQWCGMARELVCEYPSVLQTIRRLDSALLEVFQGCNSPSWTLEDALANKDGIDIDDPAVAQPLCTAVQIALVVLLNTWGVRPVATVGHSSGEISAAFAAGLLTDLEAIVLAYVRGLCAAGTTHEGAMLAVGSSAAEVKIYLDSNPLPGTPITIACVNSPQSVTLSGDANMISMIEFYLKTQNIFNRRLKIGKAYHSDFMKTIGEQYEKESTRTLKMLHSLPMQHRKYPRSAMISSVTTNPIETPLGPSYWRQNLESPVLFADAVSTLLDSIHIDKVVEIGPHAGLAGPVRQIFAERSSRTPEYLPSLRRGEDSVEAMLSLAGKLYIANYPVDLRRINSRELLTTSLNSIEAISGHFIVDFPHYSYNYSQIHWSESRMSKEWRFRPHGRHDILGSRLPGTSRSTHIWRNVLHRADLPWLNDHKVAGQVIFPAAGYIAMAIEACCQIVGDGDDLSGPPPSWFKAWDQHGYEINNLKIAAALPLERNAVETIVELKAIEWTKSSRSSTAFEFSILSLSHLEKWIENASGIVKICAEESLSKDFPIIGSPDYHMQKRSAEHYYEALSSLGLIYGPSFACLSSIMKSDGSKTATATTSLTPTAAFMQAESRYVLHPITIDTCLQLSMCALSSGELDDMTDGYVPVSAEKIHLRPSVHSKCANATVWSEASRIGSRSISVTSGLCDNNGQQLLNIERLRLSSIGAKQTRTHGRDPYYRIEWHPDVDYLTQEKVELLYANRQEISREFILLDRLTFLCMVELLETRLISLSPDDHTLPPHLQKFRQWMWSRANDTPHSSTIDSKVIRDIKTASSKERKSEIEHVAKTLSASKNVEAQLVLRVYNQLSDLLSEKISAIDLLAQGGLWTNFQKHGLTYRAAYSQLEHATKLLAHKVPDMDILEVGSGTGGCTRIVLDALHAKTGFPRYRSYTFTDISTGFFPNAQEEFHGCPNMHYRLLDLNDDPIGQGFQPKSYDLIIAANVIHATESLVNSLKRAKLLLKPNGRLLLLETTYRGQLYGGFILGGLPGWWVGEADGRVETAVVTKEEWKSRLAEAGFSENVLSFDDYPRPYDTTCTFLASAKSKVNGFSDTVPDLFIISRDSPGKQVQLLEGIAQRCGIKTSSSVLGNLNQDIISKTVILLDTGHPVLQQTSEVELRSLKKICAHGNNVFWVTGGRNSTPEYGANIGLARVIRKEVPSVILHTFDIEIDQSTESAVEEIWQSFCKTKAADRWTSMFDRIERNGVVYIDRVVPDHGLNRFAEDDFQYTKFQACRSLALNIENTGQLDTLYFKEDFQVDEPLHPEWVEVKVEAIGVNYKDTLNALGYVDQNNFSSEAAGTVTRIGSAVQRVQPGDRAVCIGCGNYGTFMYIHQNDCVRATSQDTWNELATLPIAFCTAIYSLINLAGLKGGESALIHTAAGGVGLAAIQIARLLNVELYVSVGSEAKRAFLTQQCDIPPERIFDSRSTSFSAHIMKATGGRGVDVVLNTLQNELMHSSVSCLATCGRLIEIGQRDIMDNGKLDLGLLSRSRTFSSFLLTDISTDRRMAETLDEMMRLRQSGRIVPISPLTVYDISRLSSALMSLRNPNHAGKVVVSWNQESTVRFKPTTKRLKLRSDAAYLLIGCLGGVGRGVAVRLLDRGARNFIFLSRSGSSKSEASALVELLERRGASVKVVCGDVSNSTDVDRAVRGAKAPIRGVINAAMVLEDSYFDTLDTHKLDVVMRPKLDGTINLHKSLIAHKEKVDFFLTTGSISGVLGIPGQASYGAANTFLDSFANYRHSLGLPASTLDIGIVHGVGFVHENPEVSQILSKLGLYGIPEKEVLDAFEKAIDSGTPLPPQTRFIQSAQLVIGLEPSKFRAHMQSLEAGAEAVLDTDPRLAILAQSLREGSEVTEVNGGASLSLKALIKDKDLATRQETVKRLFLQRFATLLALDPEDIDEAQPLAIYGMDSMVSSSLRSWIFRELEVDISLLEFLNASSTIHSMALRALDLFQKREAMEQNGVSASTEV